MVAKEYIRLRSPGSGRDELKQGYGRNLGRQSSSIFGLLFSTFFLLWHNGPFFKLGWYIFVDSYMDTDMEMDTDMDTDMEMDMDTDMDTDMETDMDMDMDKDMESTI